MLLKGSCHCNSINFEVESNTPVPYMRCYCSICRKVGSGAPFGTNIMGNKASLKITKEEAKISEYKAIMNREAPESEHKLAGNIRYFCSKCSSNLWAYDEKYAEWVYPVASAIDTPLPTPPKICHIMLNSKANWVPPISESSTDNCFTEYPNKSVEDWHKSNSQWTN
ncbi:putative glutathione-dependent formaldehyde-activating [Conidiobolus coronatus NRRL 28638]|uniref:Putative glutathione-dependent formaldehyde-activating n=1 Tax=Conidiobolus coronatus (strain ATCC 28846 / CBS 209.66 / NRRL 28638) TaxID=796925 RepID=A0A137PG49_CONC2|nr:putative glutathione-dependent formaldehyde-activating [Conidiobolus coronatus NRRL 28638]|eukprot:KXN73979.1 putative glutathione-dependent formaldehyde-activating [Conidiobolus coronatus NRRL 28638]